MPTGPAHPRRPKAGAAPRRAAAPARPAGKIDRLKPILRGTLDRDGRRGVRPSHRRIQLAGVLLPALTTVAKQIHRGQPEVVVETAVLEAWRGLAGVREWTPAMVEAVGREIK